MRDVGRQKAILKMEALGWACLPWPASGAGRKGVHRPDLLARSPKGRRYVFEVKHPGRFPLYIEWCQVEATIRESRNWDATPALLIRKKRDRHWRLVGLMALDRTPRGNGKLSEEKYLEAVCLGEVNGSPLTLC